MPSANFACSVEALKVRRSCFLNTQIVEFQARIKVLEGCVPITRKRLILGEELT